MFKILLSRSVQTPNSDKNWQTSCPLQTFVCNISRHLEFIIEQGHRVAGSQNVTQFRVWKCSSHVENRASAARASWVELRLFDFVDVNMALGLGSSVGEQC